MSSLPTIVDLEKTITSFDGWMQAARRISYLQGAILRRVRDKGIYRLDYKTFADCVQQELGMSESRAYQLIQHVEIVEQLNISSNIRITESHTRELIKVPAEQRDNVVQKAAEAGKITARAIKQAAEAVEVKLTVLRAPNLAEDDDDSFDQATEADDEPDVPIEKQIKKDNAKIESACRAITKPLNDLSPDDLPWLKYQGIRNSAIGHIKTGCKLLRAAKCDVCPKCQGGGCDSCKVGNVMTGRVPDIVKRQLS